MFRPDVVPSSETNWIEENQFELTFSDLGLSKKLLQGIESAGFETPSPIQKLAIPHVLAGKDLIAQAQTGSGKTAAFVIPALSALKYNKTVEILVLVPTRELSLQVVQEFERLGRELRINVVNIVGGQSAYRQIEQVNRGAQVIVATPGRMLDHLSSGVLKNFNPGVVILDEADEMLDMGFIEDIRKILEYTPEDRQTLLFSATIPRPIARLAQEVLKNPEHLQLANNDEKNKDIEQRMYIIRPKERESALIRLLDSELPDKSVIFCRTKKDTIDLCDNLNRYGYKAQPLHGDMTQNERTRAIKEIKTGYTKVLVATDVASRGLDIKDLSHVFNYQLPESKERYTHRIGRTGRAGQKGTAISLLTPMELDQVHYIKGAKSSHFKLEVLPNRIEVQKKMDEALIEKIKETKICNEASSLIDDIANSKESADFILRLFSYIKKDQKVEGPEYLGFSFDESERMFKRPAKRSDRGGDRRFGGRRGGSRRPSRFEGKSNFGGSGSRDRKRDRFRKRDS